MRLVEWLNAQGPDHGVEKTPLVVFTWDAFDNSVGVKGWNWITQDFAGLLDRIANEVQEWEKSSPAAKNKDLTF